MKIKYHFEDVDQLNAKVKAVTIKNITRQAKFSAIGYHLSLFLQDEEAGLMLPYHNFVESFVGSGILVTQAKVSLQKSGLAGQLLIIKDQYECLVKLIEKMESTKYTIKEAVQAIQELDFGEDTCNINQYIKK